MRQKNANIFSKFFALFPNTLPHEPFYLTNAGDCIRKGKLNLQDFGHFPGKSWLFDLQNYAPGAVRKCASGKDVSKRLHTPKRYVVIANQCSHWCGPFRSQSVPQRLPCVKGAGKNLWFLTEGLSNCVHKECSERGKFWSPQSRACGGRTRQHELWYDCHRQSSIF